MISLKNSASPHSGHYTSRRPTPIILPQTSPPPSFPSKHAHTIPRSLRNRKPSRSTPATDEKRFKFSNQFHQNENEETTMKTEGDLSRDLCDGLLNAGFRPLGESTSLPSLSTNPNPDETWFLDNDQAFTVPPRHKIYTTAIDTTNDSIFFPSSRSLPSNLNSLRTSYRRPPRTDSFASIGSSISASISAYAASEPSPIPTTKSKPSALPLGWNPFAIVDSATRPIYNLTWHVADKSIRSVNGILPTTLSQQIRAFCPSFWQSDNPPLKK